MSSTEKYTKFSCKKLARDKVAENIKAETPLAKVNFWYLTESELKEQLLRKLEEEALEVIEAKNDPDPHAIINEISDVLEVLEVILEKFNIDQALLNQKKLAKIQARGEMKKGIYVCWVKEAINSKDWQYLNDNPQKYPVLKDLSTQSKTCFQFNKLVRDNHLDFISRTSEILIEKLSLQDQLEHLFLKLNEEVEEVRAEVSSFDEFVNELADVLEVLEGIAFTLNVNWEQILQAKEKKAARMGSFRTGLWSEWVELPEGSRLHDYCSKNPEKYKVISE